MKYALLSPLQNLITDELKDEIFQFLEQDLASFDISTNFNNNYFANNQHETLSKENANEELRVKYQNFDQGPGSFIIIRPPDNLSQRLLNRLPTKIRNYKQGPYVRIQCIQNYQLIPHIDYTRSTGLIIPITSNPLVYTKFYEQTVKHDFYRNHLPDPDLIVEKCRINFAKDETWIIDTDSIHATENLDPTRRVTVNFMWSKTTMQELISLLFDNASDFC
jgi:hypothetical protein